MNTKIDVLGVWVDKVTMDGALERLMEFLEEDAPHAV